MPTDTETLVAPTAGSAPTPRTKRSATTSPSGPGAMSMNWPSDTRATVSTSLTDSDRTCATRRRTSSAAALPESRWISS